MHDRTALPGTVYKVQVTCTAEVLDKQHGMKLKEELQRVYGSGFQWINLLPSEEDVKDADVNNNVVIHHHGLLTTSLHSRRNQQ